MATADHVSPAVDPTAADLRLSDASAPERVRWAVEQFGGSLVMSTSFGAQSAVMLHLATRIVPDIPVVFVDTGYLFPETYRFADQLCARLRVNLKVYRAIESPAWIEARHGKLWEKGERGLDTYNPVSYTHLDVYKRQVGYCIWLSKSRLVTVQCHDLFRSLACRLVARSI